MNHKGLAKKKFKCHLVRFGTPSNFFTFLPPVDQLLCSVLHKNGHATYNEHFTAYNIMKLVCAGWLHEVQWYLQWVLCTAFWSMDMTGVYACQFEAVCDVTTVPSHVEQGETIMGKSRAEWKKVGSGAAVYFLDQLLSEAFWQKPGWRRHTSAVSHPASTWTGQSVTDRQWMVTLDRPLGVIDSETHWSFSFACLRVSAGIKFCDIGRHNCHSHATCTHTLGGFHCQCAAGFTGNGTSCRSMCQGRTRGGLPGEGLPGGGVTSRGRGFGGSEKPHHSAIKVQADFFFFFFTFCIIFERIPVFFYPDYSAQFLDSMNEPRKSSWTQQTESLRFLQLSVSWTKSNRKTLSVV